MYPLVSESKEGFPILVVDRKGDLGSFLARKLSDSSTIVLVSYGEKHSLPNVIHVSFGKRIPKIPDNIYSHIFVIDDGENLTIEALPSFLKKAQEDKAIFTFCTTLGKTGLPEEIFDYKRSKILFLGDIFPQINFYPKSYVNRFLTSAKNRGRVEIPQDGMSITYPVFLEDAVLGILESSFGTSSDRVFYIFPKHGVTLLTLSHLIQKKDPDIKIDFTSEDPMVSPKIVREGKFVYENYPLEERIRNLKNMSPNFKLENFESAFDKKDFFSLANLRLFTFALLFFLFLPLITTLFFSYLGFLLLDNSSASLSASNSSIFLSRSSFDLADKFSKTLLLETSPLGLGAAERLSRSIEKGKTKTENILGYYDSLDLFSQGKASAGISRLKDFLVFVQTNKKTKFSDTNLFNFISQTINVWPQILGIESEKTYLVLFQNNQILRGTGGEIQALGLLTLGNGKITDFTVYNAYDLDKNLKGHVEPPYALRRHLASVHWHLMDASYNPDFRGVAESSAFFLDLETGKKVDGVISVGSKIIAKLLGKEEENIKIKLSDKNYLAETALSLKKNFKGQNLPKFILSEEFVNTLLAKDVILFFNDQSIENVFLAGNYSSSIAENQTSSQNQINDFTGIIETDIPNASSIGKEVEEKIEISENGEVKSTVTLNLKGENNDSKKYLRVIKSRGTVLQKIKIDGQERDFISAVLDPVIYEAKDFSPPGALEIQKETQNDKEIFGFLINSKNGKEKNIELTFSLPAQNLAALNNFSLNLRIFKQVGAVPYAYKVAVSFPGSFKIYTSPTATRKVDKDYVLVFNFGK